MSAAKLTRSEEIFIAEQLTHRARRQAKRLNARINPGLKARIAAEVDECTRLAAHLAASDQPSSAEVIQEKI